MKGGAAMQRPEILAPAGGQEQLLAAVRCGAEAVYLGTRGFNARRGAANFDDEGLADAARYCRIRGVKLYAAVNTVVLDAELPDLERTADAVARAGADGVILQDMAALRLFSQKYPHIRRIASTQTAVHNADGAKFLQDAGFDSFVLARELSLSEMEKICAAVSIPAEAFVHGAHCMSVSGMCYLSAMLGGRSGNRGLCAQPCRLDWRCGDGRCVLSMKDLSLIKHIRALERAGVSALKIEGRMKRPEYVAAAVTACRAARDGEPFDEETLRAVFSREGFTDGYFLGKPGGDMFGRRTKQDVTAGTAVLRELSGLYRAERQSVSVDMAFSAGADGSRLTVSDGKRAASADGPAPEAARSRALDGDGAKKNLTRTGGTPYFVRSFRADIAPGLALSAAALNDMRRRALGALDEMRAAAPAFSAGRYEPAPAAPRAGEAGSALLGRFFRAEQVVCEDAFERVILPVEEIGPDILARLGDRLAAELPAALFPNDEGRLYERLAELKKQGLRELWADNIYGVVLGRRLGLGVRGGFGLNVTNTQAVDFYEKQGLLSLTASFELPMSAVRSLGGRIPLGIAAYGYLPLMRFRNCPVRANVGCAACGGRGEITDRRGVAFPVECGGKTYAALLNSVPLHIAGRDAAGDFRLLYFTRESAAECRRATEEFIENRRADGPRTGGLYYRKLY